MSLRKYIPVVLLSLSSSIIFSQNLDKKEFCRTLNEVVTTFSENAEGMKGDFNGENSLGIRQWKTKILLPAAIEGIFESYFTLGLEEKRLTYFMLNNAPQQDAQNLYKQIVQAVKSCYGAQYALHELISNENDYTGKKYEQLEANFTYTEEAFSKTKLPSIKVNSVAIHSGLYAVTAELFFVSQ